MERPDPSSSGHPRPAVVLLIGLVSIAVAVGGIANFLILGRSLILLPALAAASGQAPTAPDRSALAAARTISWRACGDRELRRLHARCGYLRVPLDRAYPNGTPVFLAVSRILHTAARSQGVMIVNPGGPGDPGLETVDVSEDLPASVAGQYDWVGFDPRGVGESFPSLACDEQYFDGPRPGYSPTAAHIAAWTARAKAYAVACAGNGNTELLQHMTTVDSARDIDALRVALGQRRIDYYGFSYGTYLGQVYATLFPGRVRRMVLDSTEDPRAVDDQYGFAQDAAFEIAIGHYFAWVAKWDSVYHLGSTARAVRHRYATVRVSLAAHPQRQVGAAEWDDIFLDAAYYQADWSDLTDTFAEQVQDPDGRDLEDAWETYGQPGDNAAAAFLAVECTDGPVDRSVPAMLAAVRQEATVAPFSTWGDAWYRLPCDFWPVESARTAFAVDGSRVRSVLMIDETLDGPTPYAGSLHVRNLFPGARLIAQPGGTSHAETPDPDSPCTMHWIVQYLSSGSLPARAAGTGADATCAPPPEPTPDE